MMSQFSVISTNILFYENSGITLFLINVIQIKTTLELIF